MNAPAPRIFGHSTVDLDRAMYRIVHRQINRAKVRDLVNKAKVAKRRLLDRGIYSPECWAYEEDYKAKSMDAFEAFWRRNDV